MSEEAIKTAQQFVDSLQVLSEECDSATEILAATLDDHSGAREILVAHMAQQLDTFASQVCEQREKEHATDVECIRLLTKRAEAAELALQAAKKELAENEEMDEGNFRAFKLLEERNAELILALQAASEEHEELMAALQALKLAFATNEAALQFKQETLDNWGEQINALDSDLRKAEAERAQARQQAVAETSELCAQFADAEANVSDREYRGTRQDACRNIAKGIRFKFSLTPPPALTKEK